MFDSKIGADRFIIFILGLKMNLNFFGLKCAIFLYLIY